MRASENGHKEVVKLLLDHGADTIMQDNVSVSHMVYMIDISPFFVYMYAFGLLLPLILVVIDGFVINMIDFTAMLFL